jgi:hypothetical protein
MRLDCTILLGITLALRRRGRYGLLFLAAMPSSMRFPAMDSS